MTRSGWWSRHRGCWWAAAWALGDPHCVLVRDARALQPNGWGSRGVASASPARGGRCAPWCALVVAARAVGRWAIGAAPRPLGPVHGGNAGRGPIAFAVAASCRRGRRWWVVRSPHEVSAALFCTTLGLSLADGSSGVCPGRPTIVVVVVVEALGVPRSWWCWWCCVVAAVSGLPGHSTQSASRAYARRGGLYWA